VPEGAFSTYLTTFFRSPLFPYLRGVGKKEEGIRKREVTAKASSWRQMPPVEKSSLVLANGSERGAGAQLWQTLNSEWERIFRPRELHYLPRKAPSPSLPLFLVFLEVPWYVQGG